MAMLYAGVTLSLVICLLVVSRVYILILKYKIRYGSFYAMKIKNTCIMRNVQDFDSVLYIKAVRSVIYEG